MTTTVAQAYTSAQGSGSEGLILSLSQQELRMARDLYRSRGGAIESAFLARDYTLHPEAYENGVSPRKRLLRPGMVGNVQIIRPPMGLYRRYAKKINKLTAKNPERYARKINQMTIVLRLAYIRGHIELNEN